VRLVRLEDGGERHTSEPQPVGDLRQRTLVRCRQNDREGSFSYRPVHALTSGMDYLRALYASWKVCPDDDVMGDGVLAVSRFTV
jgi:hypothetical protein